MIELLVVIAIIAILSVVVILTLNPAQLIMQSHDANRLSDLQTINTALGVYSEDVGTSFGNASTTYIDIADPLATSTAGDQCQGLGLPSLPTGLSYHCPASSTLRNTDGTGWLPTKLSSISIGNPLGTLPVDPTNSTSSNLYYSYNTNGSQYQLNAHFESQKYIPMEAQSGGYDPATYNLGNNLSIAPWTGGMVGYWPLNEGSGTTAFDKSGLNDNGIWSGTATGTAGTYYTTGNNQTYAGDFDGNTDYVSSSVNLAAGSAYTISFWSHNQNPQNSGDSIMFSNNGGSSFILGFEPASSHLFYALGTYFSNNYSSIIASTAWHSLIYTLSGTTINLYIDGQFQESKSFSSLAITVFNIGDYTTSPGTYNYKGFIDDFRIYNRVLSASEIAAMYAAGR